MKMDENTVNIAELDEVAKYHKDERFRDQAGLKLLIAYDKIGIWDKKNNIDNKVLAMSRSDEYSKNTRIAAGAKAIERVVETEDLIGALYLLEDETLPIESKEEGIRNYVKTSIATNQFNYALSAMTGARVAHSVKKAGGEAYVQELVEVGKLSPIVDLLKMEDIPVEVKDYAKDVLNAQAKKYATKLKI